MGIRKYNPTTPGRRGATVSDFAELTPGANAGEESAPAEATQGRTQQPGQDHRAASRRRSQAALRLIDFRRDKDGIPAKVDSIQYDPNRTCRIALLHYVDGEKRYILAPDGLKAGDQVMSGADAPVALGNCLPLSAIPLGTDIHNIEMLPGRGGVLCRSAGIRATLAARDADWAQINLPSGEIRRVPARCRATIGIIGNSDHMGIVLGKAGRKRWLGRRPHVRGTAMNPIDHPHGGGEGRTKGGRHPVSPTGVLAKGGSTRKRQKALEQGDRPAAKVAAIRAVEDQVVSG